MELLTLHKTDALIQKESTKDALIDSRIDLELKIVSLAASRRSVEDLEHLNSCLQTYIDKVLDKKDARQEDLLFHLAIARACGNTEYNKRFLIMAVDILNFEKQNIPNCDEFRIGCIKKYQAIFKAIISKNTETAKEKMKDYLESLYANC